MNCILIEIGSRSASDDDNATAAVTAAAAAAASFKWQHLMHLFDLNISTCFILSCNTNSRLYGHQSHGTQCVCAHVYDVQAHATNVPCSTFIFLLFFHSFFHAYLCAANEMGNKKFDHTRWSITCPTSNRAYAYAYSILYS